MLSPENIRIYELRYSEITPREGEIEHVCR